MLLTRREWPRGWKETSAEETFYFSLGWALYQTESCTPKRVKNYSNAFLAVALMMLLECVLNSMSVIYWKLSVNIRSLLSDRSWASAPQAVWRKVWAACALQQEVLSCCLVYLSFSCALAANPRGSLLLCRSAAVSKGSTTSAMILGEAGKEQGSILTWVLVVMLVVVGAPAVWGRSWDYFKKSIQEWAFLWTGETNVLLCYIPPGSSVGRCVSEMQWRITA